MFALYPTTVQQFKLQRYKEFSKQLTQVGQHFKNENNKYYAIQRGAFHKNNSNNFHFFT